MNNTELSEESDSLLAIEDGDNTLTILQKQSPDLVTSITIPIEKEFSQVPRYKRGGLEYKYFEAICKLINEIALRKQRTLASARENLTPQQRVSMQAWKLQMNQEVEHLTFVTDDDIMLSGDAVTELEVKSHLKNVW